MLHMRKAKLFRRPNIFIKSKHLIFFTKICGFPFFGHPAWLKKVFYSLVLSIFEKKAPKMLHIIKAKFFRRPNILITTIYLIFALFRTL